MNRFLNQLTIVILPILMLASCVTEMEVNEISLEQEVNVNGICIAGEPISATLLLTVPRIREIAYFNDTIPYNELENAIVKLWVDGIETEQMTYLPADTTDRYNADYTDSSEVVYLGYYKGQTICQPGKTYKIEASHPEYKTINCQTTVPNGISNVTIGDVNIQKISTNDSGWSPFKITFTDTPNEKNYYRVFIAYTKGEKRSDRNADSILNNEILVWNRDYRNFTFEDPILFPENENANDLIFGSVENKYHLFNDDFIDGKTHELEFTASGYSTSFDHELVAGEFFKLTVTLQIINEDEYLYLKSLTQYIHFKDDFLAEPVLVYTNIENGVGIFSGAINYSRTFQYGKYPIDGFQYYYEKFGGINFSSSSNQN